MNCAFVLGNGKSRKGLNLHRLKLKGKIYGCNALYREFAPDYLIAVDPKMVIEISKSGYQLSNEVWTNKRRSTDNIQNMNYFEKSLGWSSGPTALTLASNHGYNKIYILGFDYNSQDGYLNNVYAGTENYRKTTDTATYYGNWLKQTYNCIKRNPNTRYIRVITEEHNFVPDDLKTLGNLEHIDIVNFKKELKIP